jgi:hypothetical protein
MSVKPGLAPHAIELSTYAVMLHARDQMVARMFGLNIPWLGHMEGLTDVRVRSVHLENEHMRLYELRKTIDITTNQ